MRLAAFNLPDGSNRPARTSALSGRRAGQRLSLDHDCAGRFQASKTLATGGFDALGCQRIACVWRCDDQRTDALAPDSFRKLNPPASFRKAVGAHDPAHEPNGARKMKFGLP